jgi:hypothetical protein
VEELREALRETLDRFRTSHEADSRSRLEDEESLSLNEQQVLADLGARDEWYEQLLGLGESAFRLAQDLTGTSWEANYVLQDAVDPANPYHGIPKRGLELAAAEQFIDTLPRTISRAEEIIWAALDAHPSPKVSAYMRRLGRCYLAGLDAEVVILCRAVLDTALRDVLGDKDTGPSSFYDRIELLRKRGALSEGAIAASHQIRIRGNKAVHEEPAEGAIALETLRMTMLVVAELIEEE